MNKIASALPTSVAPRPVGRLQEPIEFAALRNGSQEPVKPLDGLRFSDVLVHGVTAAYELAKRVLLAVYRFFACVFSSGNLGKTLTFKESDYIKIEKEGQDPKVAKQLGEALKATFPTKVQYRDDKDPIELGTFIFEHLLEKGKGGVEFDPESKVYSVTFSKANKFPITFNDDVRKRLNGHVVDPVLSHAKVVQFKLGEGKMELFGDSLTVNATVKGGPFGGFTVDATVEGLVGQAPYPIPEMFMHAAIRLNEGTNAIVRGIVNNVICPLVNADLSRIKVRRERAIRILHNILYQS
ncbi:MAG TPA: hypothetical protein VIJ46_06270 [Rhabdochlamydiaceae bacterium]